MVDAFVSALSLLIKKKNSKALRQVLQLLNYHHCCKQLESCLNSFISTLRQENSANQSSTSPLSHVGVRIPSLHIPSHFPQISFMIQGPKSPERTVRVTKPTVTLNDVEVDLGKMHANTQSST